VVRLWTNGLGNQSSIPAKTQLSHRWRQKEHVAKLLVCSNIF